MKLLTPRLAMVVVFLGLLVTVPLIQCVVEMRQGEMPAALRIFTRMPTRENLHAFEHSLEEASVTIRNLRPKMQAMQFFGLKEAGSKALIGKDGWLFYAPGIEALTERPKPGDSSPEEALAAVIKFRNDLAARGIKLLLLPMPNKESVYPEQLSSSAKAPDQVINPDTKAFLAGCKAAHVEVVDLFSLFRESRNQAGMDSTGAFYLAQDSHWSPKGMELASASVAKHLLALGWLEKSGSMMYELRQAPINRHGDLVRLLRSPEIEARLTPEAIPCSQVFHKQTGELYHDDPESDVLLLGDSFLRIYQQDEPGGAGFIAHLAKHLERPFAGIVNDGGASTLVRQELFRRPKLLKNKKVVIWEFVERDLRLGQEGWQPVPLPSIEN